MKVKNLLKELQKIGLTIRIDQEMTNKINLSSGQWEKAPGRSTYYCDNGKYKLTFHSDGKENAICVLANYIWKEDDLRSDNPPGIFFHTIKDVVKFMEKGQKGQ